MKPERMPNPSPTAEAKIQEVDKLQELGFVFRDAGIPEDVDLPDLPDMPDLGASPTAPELPDLSLPIEAYVDFEIPVDHLPMDIFG